MTLIPLLPLLLISALFDVRALPLADPAATVLLANADADKTADLFLLNGNRLTAYPTGSEVRPATAALPEGTSGFDIADIDGDGFAEIIAVCGDNIVSHELTGPGAAPASKTLFSLHTQLAAPAVQPYPYVMVLPGAAEEGKPALPTLALPCESTFELRNLDGTLVASFPIGSTAAHRISYGSPFSVAWQNTPQAGPPGSIEAEVSRVIAFEPELPSGFVPTAAPPILYRLDGQNGAPPPPADQRRSWPWFPLKTDGTTNMRALYALAAPGYGDSLIRVREAKSDNVDLSGKNVVLGPERRYPGKLCVHQEDFPDFNGDGFVDVLLWKAPQPGMSLDSVMRIALRQDWEIILTAHLFNPEKKRFEPRPASHIMLKAPFEWFTSAASTGPLRHLVLRDFNGDGRTDLGCAVAPNQWAAWLFGEKGFARRPDFNRKFDEPIERVEFRAALDGGSATSVGIRTKNAIHLLRPSTLQE